MSDSLSPLATALVAATALGAVVGVVIAYALLYDDFRRVTPLAMDLLLEEVDGPVVVGEGVDVRERTDAVPEDAA